MILSSFAIQFMYASQSEDGKAIGRKNHVYQANINTLSKSFSLFEVTGIRKITKTRIIRLPGAYYLTTYPLYYAGKEAWKDAVTANTDQFLQAIGDAIETHLTTLNKQICNSLN